MPEPTETRQSAEKAAIARVEAVLAACEERLQRSPDRVLSFWVREVRAALTPPAEPERRPGALGDLCACPAGDGARHYWHPTVCPRDVLADQPKDEADD